MKMIVAIVNRDDAGSVSSALTQAGFSATKLATTGGFLAAGNTTFIVGTDEARVDEAVAVIEKHCRKRSQTVPGAGYGAAPETMFPVEVTVGGATLFVLDVERFEKI
ncbi:MAG: cyclic-di-AMP receptor [Oscillospiraceae bacterium]|nr:cyclic-di-AMP receptor [Oscillospiraceae bacterium]